MVFQSATWMKKAACVVAPDWVDFSPLDVLLEDPRPAQAYCASCPVTADCLLWATVLDDGSDEWIGVWGGMTDDERRKSNTTFPVACPSCGADSLIFMFNDNVRKCEDCGAEYCDIAVIAS